MPGSTVAGTLFPFFSPLLPDRRPPPEDALAFGPTGQGRPADDQASTFFLFTMTSFRESKVRPDNNFLFHESLGDGSLSDI